MSATISAAIAILGVIACLSSRTGPSETVTGECRVPLSAEVPGSTVIVIGNFAFQPASVHIKPGTKVTWVNCDGGGVTPPI